MGACISVTLIVVTGTKTADSSSRPKNVLCFCVIQECNYIGLFQKRSTLPPWRKCLPEGGGGGEKFLSDNSVLGHPKGYED